MIPNKKRCQKKEEREEKEGKEEKQEAKEENDSAEIKSSIHHSEEIEVSI